MRFAATVLLWLVTTAALAVAVPIAWAQQNIVGAAGWAAVEVARRSINDALNRTTGDIRRVADAMVGYAEGSLHQWLNLTLVAGGVLVAFGVVVAMLSSLRKSTSARLP